MPQCVSCIIKLDPEPLSERQFMGKTKRLYASLVPREKLCGESITTLSRSEQSPDNHMWNIVLELHTSLLDLHVDLHTHDHKAPKALKSTIIRNQLPHRMWQRIHAFLDLLLRGLPGSMQYMTQFVDATIHKLTVLVEEAPSLAEVWTEMLGDIARYYMTIESHSPYEYEQWMRRAQMWYNQALDLKPHAGRLSHHLGFLAKPHSIEQLFYYTKSLIDIEPFLKTGNIELLFRKSASEVQAGDSDAESSFLRAFAIMFERRSLQDFYTTLEQLRHNLSTYIDSSGECLLHAGPQIAVIMIAGLLDFGKKDSLLWNSIIQQRNLVKALRQYFTNSVAVEGFIQDAVMKEASDGPLFPPAIPDPPVTLTSMQIVSLGGRIFQMVISTFASRADDRNVVPFMHLILANVWGLSFFPRVLLAVESFVPWNELKVFLNALDRSGISYTNVEADAFPPSHGGSGKQLPEDFFFRGCFTSKSYYPPQFFQEELVEQCQRHIELPSHRIHRAERCLYIAVRIAKIGRYLTYDENKKEFDITEYAADLRQPASESMDDSPLE